MPIEDDEPVHVTPKRDGTREVDRGLRFEDTDGDLGFCGIYDAWHRRANVKYSGG